MKRLLLGLIVLLAPAAQAATPSIPMTPLPPAPVIRPAMACEALRDRDFARDAEAPAEILTAETVAAKDGVPEHCRVTGYVQPQVQFELHLPTATYTGRYLQNGCGGNCGFIRMALSPSCDTAQAQGGAFATAATNSGHVGGSLWARDNPALQQDFAERAAHVTALAAKAIVAAYYGQGPRRSYFSGCSDGGREAMKEARLYPQDFDGIIAGAPANYVTSAFIRFAWMERANRGPDGRPLLDKPAVELLHKAVMNACDARDGLKDGQIDEPRACRLDPASLLCKSGQTSPNCLNAAQVAAARAFYSGPVDAAGVRLSTGGMSYGSELTWAGPSRARETERYFRDLIFGKARPAGWTLGDLAFTRAEFDEISRLGAHYDAKDPDLRAFRDRGGKMIVWEGLADPSSGPNGTLAYYQGVRNVLGGTDRTRETVRLFRLPGVYHCRDGYLPYQANMLGAVVRWVEGGVAPDAVIAAAPLPEGGVRERPIFAYPVRARYAGSGDVNRPESFGPAAPKSDPDDRYDWAGSAP